MKLLSSNISLFLIVFCCFFQASLYSKDILIINKSNKAPIAEREAILILPGVGTIFHNTKNQRKNFSNTEYDVFIPDYISRKSLNQCVTNLDDFIKKNQLLSYNKIHVIGYILGSWTINLWIQKNPKSNVSTVIYDRSPLQEKAPAILVKQNPFLSKLLFGKLIRELSITPYPEIALDQIAVGILIECNATKIIWKKRKGLESLPKVSWDKKDLNQECRDFFYAFMNHDDMYTKIENVSAELFYFIKNHQFTKEAIRNYPNNDPFAKFKK